MSQFTPITCKVVRMVEEDIVIGEYNAESDLVIIRGEQSVPGKAFLAFVEQCQQLIADRKPVPETAPEAVRAEPAVPKAEPATAKKPEDESEDEDEDDEAMTKDSDTRRKARRARAAKLIAALPKEPENTAGLIRLSSVAQSLGISSCYEDLRDDLIFPTKKPRISFEGQQLCRGGRGASFFLLPEHLEFLLRTQKSLLEQGFTTVQALADTLKCEHATVCETYRELKLKRVPYDTLLRRDKKFRGCSYLLSPRQAEAISLRIIKRRTDKPVTQIAGNVNVATLPGSA